MVALAWVAGCVDAVSYLRLGSVFTANMTGNTVLLGIAVAQGHGAAAVRSAVAIAGFCSGALIGSLLDGAAVALLPEGLVLVGLAVGAQFGLVGQPLIAASGCAMGLQAATVRRRDGTGVNVTYITGTLTTLMSRVTDRLRGRRPDHDGHEARVAFPALVWAGYAVGGLCGALAAGAWHARAFVLPAAAALLTGLADVLSRSTGGERVTTAVDR
ncbi:DUF1275 domain-containing protein [Baekduia soli]|uniref:DUF1275 domain-containing protein n=1 Tax=Baekduia soli TaxID=496014 RepID=A0A5B8U5G4_9ACTN|nr:YoaK family protein [Baekduia soli]QEC48227.1 DUF1275 domain-containing protein [Baekduia soli]